MQVNATPLVLIAFATVLGFVVGSWAIGCLVGLTVVLVASLGIVEAAVELYDDLVLRPLRRRRIARRREGKLGVVARLRQRFDK